MLKKACRISIAASVLLPGYARKSRCSCQLTGMLEAQTVEIDRLGRGTGQLCFCVKWSSKKDGAHLHASHHGHQQNLTLGTILRSCKHRCATCMWQRNMVDYPTPSYVMHYSWLTCAFWGATDLIKTACRHCPSHQCIRPILPKSQADDVQRSRITNVCCSRRC